jgi:hypothetical protein
LGWRLSCCDTCGGNWPAIIPACSAQQRYPAGGENSDCACWSIRRLVELGLEGEEVMDDDDPFRDLDRIEATNLRWSLRDIRASVGY